MSRRRKPGKPHAPDLLLRRFWARVSKSASCWLWTGARAPNGYGHILARGVIVAVHRLSWEVHAGPIPDGLCVLHRCDIRHCVRPDHLFLGTHRDNSADMIRKGRDNGFATRPRPRGAAHWRSRQPELTEQQRADIVAKHRAGATYAALVAEYRRSTSTIWRALTNRRGKD